MIKTWWLGCQESTQGLNSNPHRPQDMESNDHDRKDVQRAVGDGLTNREPSVPMEEAVVNRNSVLISTYIHMFIYMFIVPGMAGYVRRPGWGLVIGCVNWGYKYFPSIYMLLECNLTGLVSCSDISGTLVRLRFVMSCVTPQIRA